MKQWQFWVLPVGYFIVQGALPAYQPIFALWLKSTHHSVYQINVWPTGQAAVGIVVQLVAAGVSDSVLRGRRWEAITVMEIPTLFSMIVLAVWTVPQSLKFVAYYLAYFQQGVPGIYYSWYPDLIPHDHEMRGFVIAASNTFSFVNSVWWTSSVWRTVDAPAYHTGFIAASVWGGLLLLLVLLVRYLEIHDVRKRELEKVTRVDEETPAVSSSDKGEVAIG